MWPFVVVVCFCFELDYLDIDFPPSWEMEEEEWVCWGWIVRMKKVVNVSNGPTLLMWLLKCICQSMSLIAH